jgi:hypothetical protein
MTSSSASATPLHLVSRFFSGAILASGETREQPLMFIVKNGEVRKWSVSFYYSHDSDHWKLLQKHRYTENDQPGLVEVTKESIGGHFWLNLTLGPKTRESEELNVLFPRHPDGTKDLPQMMIVLTSDDLYQEVVVKTFSNWQDICRHDGQILFARLAEGRQLVNKKTIFSYMEKNWMLLTGLKISQHIIGHFDKNLSNPSSGLISRGEFVNIWKNLNYLVELAYCCRLIQALIYMGQILCFETNKPFTLPSDLEVDVPYFFLRVPRTELEFPAIVVELIVKKAGESAKILKPSPYLTLSQLKKGGHDIFKAAKSLETSAHLEYLNGLNIENMLIFDNDTTHLITLDEMEQIDDYKPFFSRFMHHW